MKTKNIAVIGGGPAGFMAAVVAAETSTFEINIEIFEKDILLKTILCTGNGRCNFSNEVYDFKELASNYPRGEKFLYSIFSRFNVKQTLDWFYQHGINSYAQDDKRIFPGTDKASTIRDMFLQNAKNLSIRVHEGIVVEKITKNDEKFIICFGKKQKEYDKVIIATGGSPKYTSNSGYALAKSFGHTIIDLKPSLNALRIRENFVGKLAGVSVKNVEISGYYNNKQIKKVKGDFVFTHKGVSGPLIFKMSAYCCYLDYSKNNPLSLKINFIPEIDFQTLDKEILEEFNFNPHKSLDNILKKYLPKSLTNELLKETEIDVEKKANQITKDDRKKIVKILTETELTVVSPEPEGEMVTAGGVSLKEVNPKTMESKLTNGLYFCGEVLDIDGITGGFNLQSCWSTGFIAGKNVSQS